MTKKSLQPKNKDLSQEIPPELANVIRDMPESKRQVIIQTFTSFKQHIGPLPDAETLRVYNEVIPNGGDRLMATVEKQLNHRISLETEGVKRAFNQSSTGQWMAFAIALLFGAGAWDLAKNGHEWVAGVLGAIDIVGLVTIFIVGKSQQRK